MSGHTKGPWVVFIDDTGGEWSGWPVAIYAAHDEEKMVVRPGGIWPYEWATETSQRESVANARLIAAAPDLLEAAQWAEKALERYSDALGLDVDEAALVALTKITAAITRADGGGK